MTSCGRFWFVNHTLVKKKLFKGKLLENQNRFGSFQVDLEIKKKRHISVPQLYITTTIQMYRPYSIYHKDKLWKEHSNSVQNIVYTVIFKEIICIHMHTFFFVFVSIYKHINWMLNLFLWFLLEIQIQI